MEVLNYNSERKKNIGSAKKRGSTNEAKLLDPTRVLLN